MFDDFVRPDEAGMLELAFVRGDPSQDMTPGNWYPLVSGRVHHIALLPRAIGLPQIARYDSDMRLVMTESNSESSPALSSVDAYSFNKENSPTNLVQWYSIFPSDFQKLAKEGIVTLRTPLRFIDLETRTFGLLQCKGINRVGDVAKMTKAQLGDLSIGKNAIRDVARRLGMFGFKLREQPEINV